MASLTRRPTQRPTRPLTRGLTVVATRGGGSSASLRQVASRSYTPDVVNAGLPTSMSRTRHYATSAVTSLQLVYANWYQDSGTGAETASGGTMSVTASIEYPDGVFTQVKFSAVNTGTAASGATLTSDAVTVAIPINTAFYVRTWYSNPTGGAMYQQDTGDISQNGEAFNYGGTVADLTMSGTVPNGGSASAYAPISIIATASKNAVLAIGDSRNFGTSDRYNTQSPDKGEFARSLYANRAYSIFGGPGETAANFLAASTRRQAAAANFTTIISEYGINDLTAGTTAAVLLATQASIKALFPGKAFYLTTLPPRTTSTDQWATTAQQTPFSGEAQRVLYNDAVRAGIAGNAGYIEIADQVESARNSGRWKVDGTALKYTDDGIHETQFACLAIVSSGVVNAAIPA